MDDRITLVNGKQYRHSFDEAALARLEDFLAYSFDRTITLAQSLEDTSPLAVAIRHDVDHSGAHALKFARWEVERGFRSSYYLLPTAPYFRVEGRETALALAELGHEVGIHNDALSSVGGDLDHAADRMREWVEMFRSWGLVGPVRGCADHGGRLDNTQLWTRYTPADFGLEYEAYHLHRHSNYVSDNRGTWQAPLVLHPEKQTHVLTHPCHWRV